MRPKAVRKTFYVLSCQWYNISRIMLRREKSGMMTTYDFQELAEIEERDWSYILAKTSLIRYCDYMAAFNASRILFY